MNRRFRLEPLERLRAAELERAARALVAARRAAGEAGAHRDALAARLTAAVPTGRTTPGAATAAVAHRDALREKLADAVRACVAADQGVENATRAWRDARARLRAVEILHERHRTALAADGARRDQLALDDLAAQFAARRPA